MTCRPGTPKSPIADDFLTAATSSCQEQSLFAEMEQEHEQDARGGYGMGKFTLDEDHP